MKKLMIAATAVAFGMAAFAADVPWFNGGVAEGWPTAGTGLTGGQWDGVGTMAWSETKQGVEVTAATNAPLTFTATTPKTVGEEEGDVANVTITSLMEFSPFSIEELPDVPEGAKAGVIVVKNADESLEYYVLEQEGIELSDPNVWKSTKVVATSLSVEVSVKITYTETDYGKAAYTFGTDGTYGCYVNVGEEQSLDFRVVSQACYAGDGLVKSLSATYEGDAPAVPEWIDPEDSESVAKYEAWATYYGVSDPMAALKKAYLFNVANTELAVALAEAEFKIKGITIVDGVVTVTPPEPSDIGVEFFNGEVKVRGCATIDGEYLLPADDADARFFKAFLELIPAN